MKPAPSIKFTGVRVPVTGSARGCGDECDDGDGGGDGARAYADDFEGFIVDHHLRTSVPDIFAAGDCCVVNTDTLQEDERRLWFQMRLWSQVMIHSRHFMSCHHS